MKIRHLSFVGMIFLLCVLVACKKDKDAAPEDVPPGNNNPAPNPNPNPNDSTPKPQPVFTDFFPASANIGDTITLSGENFDANVNALTVGFGGVTATVVSASKTAIKAIVPDEIAEAKTKITLFSGGNELFANKVFNLKPPVIESISHTSGFEGQTIRIKGKGFRNSYKFDQVTFGDKFIEKGATIPGTGTLTIHVPSNKAAGKYPIAVSVAGLTALAPDQFTVIVPVISSISPAGGSGTSELIITGENFKDANGGSTVVMLSDWPNGNGVASVPPMTSITNNQIKVMIPLLDPGEYKVTIRVLGSYVSAADPFTYK